MRTLVVLARTFANIVQYLAIYSKQHNYTGDATLLQ
jgi:hypothetical protein